MKKIFAIITTLIIVISIVQCGSNSDKKDSEENKDSLTTQIDSLNNYSSTPYEVKADETFHFNYKFTAGKSFKYRLTTITTTDQNVVSDSTIVNNYMQKVSRTINFNTLSIEHDTIANIKCTITDIDVYRSINGVVTTYKYGDPLDSIKLQQFTEFVGIVNTPFNLKISKHGILLSIYGVEHLADKFIELTNLKDKLTKDDIPVFQKNLSDNFLSPMITQIFREFPDKDFKIGGSWEKSMPAASIMVFKIFYKNKYNLDNIEKFKEDKIAVVSGDASITVEGETKQVARGVEYNFQKPVTSAGGKIYFNIDNGLLQKSSTWTRLEISYNMQMQGPKGLMKANTKQAISNKSIVESL